MPTWKEKKGWRYRFQFKGEKYNRAWFKTKAEARAAEEAHKKELKAAAKTREKTGMVFSEAANDYLDYSERRHVSKTYKYKRSVLQKFMEHAGDIPVESISLSLIESYLHTRHSNINFNRHRKEICSFLVWARRRGFIQTDPCFYLDRMPEPQFIRQIPTPEEMSRLILAAGEDRPLIFVLYHTLARIDEVLRLRWRDVNFQEETVTLWTRKRKGGEWAADVLPMNQVLYDTLWGLWRAREQAEWVFYNAKTQTRYNRRPKIMRTICKRAGIPYVGFHAIRHYVSSYMHDKLKFSVSRISDLLRHQDKATTEKYLQVVDPDSRAAMKALADDFLGKVPIAPSHKNQ